MPHEQTRDDFKKIRPILEFRRQHQEFYAEIQSFVENPDTVRVEGILGTIEDAYTVFADEEKNGLEAWASGLSHYKKCIENVEVKIARAIRVQLERADSSTEMIKSG
jgi:hypothetical protein